MKMSDKFNFSVSEDDEVAYVKFNDYSGKKIYKQIHLNQLLTDYNGPDIYIDINVDNEIVGIEVLL
jgi:hypothetical protein